MGNCQNQFEPIDKHEQNYGKSQLYLKKSRSRPIFDRSNVKKDTNNYLDEQMIHSVLVENKVKFSNSQNRMQDAKSETEIGRQQQELEQLDFKFYHSLALQDYCFNEHNKDFYNVNNRDVQVKQLKDNFGIKYVGEWKDKQPHGNGVLLSNTSKYIGRFQKGLKHGHGRQIFKKQVYEGQFQFNRRRGKGIRYTQNFTEVGYFEDVFKKGEIHYTNGTIQHKQQQQKSRKIQPVIQEQSIHQEYAYVESSELPVGWND